jgi:hypothetical protein
MSGRGAAVAIALLLLGAALAAAGCGLGPGADVGSVDLTVTREFGAVKLAESSGEANESDTVMRFLESEDEIETRYGGGYVKSIDGVSESERGGHPYDWFFYVNGVESPIGAAEVSLEGGEKVWWDIHNWSASEQVPAVVGSWPAPFTTGWEGHEAGVALRCIHAGAACATVAKALEREGVQVGGDVPGARAEDGAVSGESPLPPRNEPQPLGLQMLVGPWSELRTLPIGELIASGPGESGVYAEFELSQGGWRLNGLDENGKKLRAFGANAGLVAATRRYEGPPVWVVTGATGAAVRAAAASLSAGDLRDHYAVASEAGTVTPLPLRSGSR